MYIEIQYMDMHIHMLHISWGHAVITSFTFVGYKRETHDPAVQVLWGVGTKIIGDWGPIGDLSFSVFGVAVGQYGEGARTVMIHTDLYLVPMRL